MGIPQCIGLFARNEHVDRYCGITLTLLSFPSWCVQGEPSQASASSKPFGLILFGTILVTYAPIVIFVLISFTVEQKTKIIFVTVLQFNSPDFWRNRKFYSITIANKTLILYFQTNHQSRPLSFDSSKEILSIVL